jgi:hypothetical protein
MLVISRNEGVCVKCTRKRGRDSRVGFEEEGGYALGGRYSFFLGYEYSGNWGCVRVVLRRVWRVQRLREAIFVPHTGTNKASNEFLAISFNVSPGSMRYFFQE